MSARTTAYKVLKTITKGCVVLTDSTGEHVFGDQHSDLKADMHIIDDSAYAMIISKGSLGLGESYMYGKWESSSVVNLLNIFLLNDIPSKVKGSLSLQWAIAMEYIKNAPVNALQSKKNVAHHYDLGNDFYKSWLDNTLTYTSGLIESQTGSAKPLPTEELERMQFNKLERVFKQLALNPGKTVLDIGCGWAGLLLHGAKHYGLKGVGVTLSEQQLAEGNKRIQAAGLEHMITLQLQDYRDIKGQYDGVASIEMIEAVGKKHLPEYMQVVHRSLKNGGKALLQIIATARGNDPFILQYIFKGGYLPTSSEITDPADALGFILHDACNMRTSYAKTLALWHKNFKAAHAHIKQLSSEYTEQFMRMWAYYLQSCEAGFTAGNVHVYQYTFQKRA